MLWKQNCLVPLALRRPPGLLGQIISVTYPRQTDKNSLGQRDLKRTGRAEKRGLEARQERKHSLGSTCDYTCHCERTSV